MIPQLPTIAIAGTFDRLHKGHQYFISEAFKLGEKVIIGLTSDLMANRKIRNPKSEIRINTKIQNFQKRIIELEDFLRKERLLNRAEIVKINDIYGSAVEENEIEALVVTEETFEGGLAVNRRRNKLGLKPLQLLKVPLILADDKERIASTRIRWGEIDRWGRAFSMQFTNYQLPISNELRQELKKPLGVLIKGDANNLLGIADRLKKAVGKTNSIMISTVGDEVTKLCNEIGIAINLAIFDYNVARVKKYHSLAELGFHVSLRGEKRRSNPAWWDRHAPLAMTIVIKHVKNPPGHITKKLVEAVGKSYLSLMNEGEQQIIKVEGEEDLAGVPAILLAPLGSVILYGQPAFAQDRSGLRRGKPESGVVVVEVTEEMKNKILNLLGRIRK